MSGFNASVVLLAALLGGSWGWRVGTKRLYRRYVFVDHAESRGPRRWRRRRIQRYCLTALYAGLVAGGAVLVLMMRRPGL